jgi:hypothetical protein
VDRRRPLLHLAPGGVFAVLAICSIALRAEAAGSSAAAPPTPHAQHMAMMHGADAPADGAPLLPGQDAFGAIQEIVRILEADPSTDWSKVDLERLRQHLIDMNEVTLKARIAQRPVDGGFEATVTGTGRTLDALRRMVPAHLHEIETSGLDGWRPHVRDVPSGVIVTVTTADPTAVARLRALGFIGVLASGPHHQAHHLAMAQGRMAHAPTEP